MATAASPTCACAPGERSPPTALVTWVFSSSAGWPTGTVSGCGYGARRLRKPDREPRRGSICRRRCGRARTRARRRPASRQRWGRPLCRGPNHRLPCLITTTAQSSLRSPTPPSATAPSRRSLRSAWCRGAGPAPPPENRERSPVSEDEPTESAPEQPAAQPVSNPSSFFGSRVRFNRENRHRPKDEPDAPEPAAEVDLPEVDDVWTAEAAAPASQAPEDDLIYQRMLSEWLVDPRDLAHSPDLDWQSVWDRGWSAAEEVESVPVQAHTEQGLPVREPGARLVPGGADNEQNGTAHHRASEDNGIASNGGSQSGRTPAHEAPVRDPDAVRASISSHFGGVRAGRSHARDTELGTDHE